MGASMLRFYAGTGERGHLYVIFAWQSPRSRAGASCESTDSLEPSNPGRVTVWHDGCEGQMAAAQQQEVHGMPDSMP